MTASFASHVLPGSAILGLLGLFSLLHSYKIAEDCSSVWSLTVLLLQMCRAEFGFPGFKAQAIAIRPLSTVAGIPFMYSWSPLQNNFMVWSKSRCVVSDAVTVFHNIYFTIFHSFTWFLFRRCWNSTVTDLQVDFPFRFILTIHSSHLQKTISSRSRRSFTHNHCNTTRPECVWYFQMKLLRSSTVSAQHQSRTCLDGSFCVLGGGRDVPSQHPLHGRWGAGTGRGLPGGAHRQLRWRARWQRCVCVLKLGCTSFGFITC